MMLLNTALCHIMAIWSLSVLLSGLFHLFWCHDNQMEELFTHHKVLEVT